MTDLIAQREINSILARTAEYTGLTGVDHLAEQIGQIAQRYGYKQTPAVTEFLQAVRCDRSGKIDQAVDHFEACIEQCDKAEFQLVMQAHISVASIYCELGDNFESYHHYKQVLNNVSKLDDRPLCQLFTNLGGFFLILRRYDKAVEYGYQAIDAARRGSHQTTHLIALVNTGLALGKLGRFSEGLPLLDSALEHANKLNSDRALAIAHGYLADFLADSNLPQRVDATRHFEAASRHFSNIGQGYDSLFNDLRFAEHLINEKQYDRATVIEAEAAEAVARLDSDELLLRLEKLQISLSKQRGCSQDLIRQFDSYVSELENQYQSSLTRESTLILQQVDKLQLHQAGLVAQQVEENLDAITAIGQLISTSEDLDRVLAQVYAEVQSIFPADEFGIALYEPDTQQLNYRYFIGVNGKDEPVTYPCDKVINFGSYAILNSSTVHLNSVTSEVLLSYMPDSTEKQRQNAIGDGSTNSVLITPVKLGNEILGLLSVQHQETNQYHQHHRKLFEQLASLIAIALKNIKQREALQQSYARLKRISTTDPLTKVYNRHHLKSLVPKLVSSSAKQSLSLAIIIIDIDFYKSYNDSFGHFAGDHALVSVANALTSVFSGGNEHIFRYGGDEFLVLTQGNSAERTRAQLDILQSVIEGLGLPNPQSLCSDKLTLSIGAEHSCTISNDTKHFNRAFEKADNNLYQIKNDGRADYLLTIDQNC